MKAAALAAMMMLGAPVVAGTLGGGPELGDAEPWPEAVMTLTPGLQVYVRILDDATGQPAADVVAPKLLRVEAGVVAAADLAETTLALTCRVVRLDPQGQPSPPLSEGACFQGVLAGAGPEWAPLQFDVRFSPAADEPNGTAGVVVTVQEAAGPRGVNVLATYRWSGGGQ